MKSSLGKWLPDRIGRFVEFGIHLFIVTMVLSSNVIAQAGKKSPVGNDHYLGVGSCSSSNCHGSTNPRSGADIKQNEYVTWFKHGSHGSAWKVLTNSDSQKIAKNLGIGSPEAEPLCLQCHSTFVPKELRGEKFQLEDGVSCESCHGPAERWISSHTAAEATHASNVKDGMWDIYPLKERASLCLSCHYGTDKKTVNHRLIGAGHPRLSFELDTYSMLQPKHWDVDDDYRSRKGPYNSAQAWLTGQTVLSAEVMEALLSDVRSKHGPWPELSLFTCFSCHHSLTRDEWKTRSYGGQPGELRYNLASLMVVVEALRIVDPSLAEQLSKLTMSLHQSQKSGDGRAVISKIKALLDGPVLAKVSTTTPANAELLQLLKKMVAFAAQQTHYQYEEAEQLTMGIASILATMRTKEYSSELDAIYTSLRNPEDFNAEEFTVAANAFLKRFS